MSKPVIQALNNLIPRHSGALPPELIELASSLLAQSRNKCSNLKQDEEIARAYACANLACERLKTTLNLPPIEPRPPLPPRVYSKLYAYFDRTLTTSAARNRAKARSPPSKASSSTLRSSPSKATSSTSRTTASSKQTQPLPQRLTRGKEKSFQSFRKNRTERKGLRYTSNTDKDERIPRWVGPAIRLLCREMETPRAVPHLLAGVESVLCLPCPSDPNGENEKGVEGKIPALIAALWFFVVVKMRGKEGQGKENLARKKMVRDVLVRVKEDEGVKDRVGDEENTWEGWEEIVEKDVNAWRKEIVVKGWREMDWFENIEDGCGVDGEIQSETDDGEDDDLSMSEELGSEVRRRATASMIQEKYIMTPAKKKEYEEWRDMMLAGIDKMIEDGILDDGMDTAEG
ncbi:origin recognition complex, subunit 6 [Hyaloscypha sp. PMI_1271]|nr:origin recognition complex, subunit 6 [Hyaloscypha sp. PMI_1271]